MLKSNAASAARVMISTDDESIFFEHPGDNQWRRYEAIISGAIRSIALESNDTSVSSIDEVVIRKIEAMCIEACADNTPKGQCSAIKGLYCDPRSFNSVRPFLTESAQCAGSQAGEP